MPTVADIIGRERREVDFVSGRAEAPCLREDVEVVGSEESEPGPGDCAPGTVQPYRLGRLRQSGAEAFVPDDDLMFVRAVFVSPAPVGSRADVAVRRGRLRQRDELTLRHGAVEVSLSRAELEGLALVDGSLFFAKITSPVDVAFAGATIVSQLRGIMGASSSARGRAGLEASMRPAVITRATL